MKKTVLLVLVACWLISARGQRPVDILHYQFSLEINDAHDTIYGKAVILLSPLKPGNSVQVDFAGNRSNKKSMQVISCFLQSPSPAQNMDKSNAFIHQNDKITVEAWQHFVAGDTLELIILYKGVPSDGLIISKNMFGKRTLFADNWPNRAHYWIPCVDEPGDKAPVEFLVTAPAHYQVISNGIQVEETNLPANKKRTHWREDVPLPTKVMVIGVADFAVQHTGYVNNCIPVSSWVFPENRDNGFHDYSIGKNILAFYDRYIGPYPYRKLANVQSRTMYGGMENAGAIFYYESSVNGQQAEEGLFAHEIVHQWFGDMATEKSFAHLWLSEGFATYLTHVFMEHQYGTDSLNNRMNDDRAAVLSFVKESKRPVVDSTSDFKSLLNSNSYQKGSWVLHMLRRQLGDSVFHESIRQYYAQYGGRNAETRDLQQVFEKVAGRSLEIFFSQWLFRKENPGLLITWKNNLKENTVAVTVEQTQHELFEMPLEMLLITGLRDNLSKNVSLTKRKDTFIFPINSPVLQLDADYKTSLLAEITVKEEK